MRRRAVAVLVFASIFAVAVAGCGGGEEVAPTAETVEGTVGGETETEGETEGATGETAEETTEDGEGAAQGDATAGKAVYEANGCGGCHALEAAGSSGNVGPNLDDAKPDFELVVDRVTNGRGVMPSFGDELSEKEINDVAAFVVESTSGS
jgi:mono/diheme cytochrome c family protein